MESTLRDAPERSRRVAAFGCRSAPDRPGVATNGAVLFVVMPENSAVISNAAASAAVPGVDSLLIGTSNLSMELGIPGQLQNARNVDAYRILVEPCQAHGKFAGIGG